MRSATAWIKTRPSTRRTAWRRCRYRASAYQSQRASASNALLVPGGVQPDLKMPTLISCSLRVEQQISQNTSLTRGLCRIAWLSRDRRRRREYARARPSARHRPVQRFIPNVSRRVGGYTGPGGFVLHSDGQRRKPTRHSRIRGPGFRVATASYNSLQVDSEPPLQHDLSLRGVYTWSKALDDGDSLNATTAGNAPGLVSNPYDVTAPTGDRLLTM